MARSKSEGSALVNSIRRRLNFSYSSSAMSLATWAETLPAWVRISRSLSERKPWSFQSSRSSSSTRAACSDLSTHLPLALRSNCQVFLYSCLFR